MMRPVVGFRHHHPHELGVVAEALSEAGIPHRTVDAWTDATWPDPAAVSGLVVLGGEMNADETTRYPFLARERAYLRDAVAAGVPVLGICLGAQVLARAFGAPVARSPVAELGFRRLRATPEGARDPVIAPFHGVPVFEWHADTFAIPAGAVHLATGDEVSNQAFRVGPCGYGVQFHPEATLEGIAAWTARWEPEVREAGRTPEDVLKEAAECLPDQRAAARIALGAFAQLVAERG